MSELRTLPFWNFEYYPNKPALWVNGDVFYSYGELNNQIEIWENFFFDSSKKCVLYYCENHPVSVAVLTAILSIGHVLILADPKLSKTARCRLEEAYAPHWIVDGPADNPNVSRYNDQVFEIHQDLCLMLSTSGSTGSPKYVRLSKKNILSNASAIGEILDIDASDIAAAHMDLHYSYGLSVVTSHILKGAGISFSKGKFTDREFWHSIKKAKVTHLAGVPLHYQMMSRLHFERLSIPNVRVMTQAGGPLAETIRDHAYEFMQSRNGKFYVMYGQTEAAPRMSTLQHSDYEAKKNTVGLPLPGGSFHLLDGHSNTLKSGDVGQVVYEGPNVMMGYAHGWEDLKNEDHLNGRLETGDLGTIDASGFLTIVGRISRIGKVFGLRINLDEVETNISRFGKISVIQVREYIGIICENGEDQNHSNLEKTLSEHLTKQFQIPVSAFKYIYIAHTPVTSRNKTDYNALKTLVQDQ